MPCGAAFPTTRSLGDKTSGIYADPTKIEKIDFDGEYLKCHATPSVLPSAQLRPVLFQAGSSGRGRRFAVDHADVIFAIQPYLPRMGTFMTQIRDAAATAWAGGGHQGQYALPHGGHTAVMGGWA